MESDVIEVRDDLVNRDWRRSVLSLGNEERSGQDNRTLRNVQ